MVNNYAVVDTIYKPIYDLSKLCQKLEALHPGTSVTNNLLEKCKMLVSPSNDLSTIRAKYPHDVVNHLSCDEAKNHYGGVVSLIPIVLDCMKAWVAHSEKLPRNFLHNVSDRRADSQKTTHQNVSSRASAPLGPCPDTLTTATQTLVSYKGNPQKQNSKHGKNSMNNPGSNTWKSLNGPWKPPGKHSF
ncbi:sperm acrosome-associated protein 9 isoform X2 [Carettochelys insculpta]|uniref:sperm acrosome-associated protein 9 isoform X2 n=1 Tax=Carettochelys insculpta TaxID=44489 RepID=UPI003EBC5FCD